jgi:hypothetical protein
MADSDNDGDKAAEKAEKKARTARRVMIFSLMVMSLAFLPSTIVLVICMIPTLVAVMVDRHPQKTAWITVGAMNFAGSLPVWVMLLQGGHTLEMAFQIVTRPAALVVAYGGAAIGWFVYNNVTPLVAGVVLGRNERRLKDIDKRQKELVRKWGEDVAKG